MTQHRNAIEHGSAGPRRRRHDALLEQQPWFHGIYWWHWEPYVGGGGTSDDSDALNNKPAEATITRWFGGSGQPAPAPPPARSRAANRRPPARRAPPRPGTAGVNNPAFDPVPSPGPDSATRMLLRRNRAIPSGAAFLAYWRATAAWPLRLSAFRGVSGDQRRPTASRTLVQYFERQRFEYHPEAPRELSCAARPAGR